jgi:hypothetical protein
MIRSESSVVRVRALAVPRGHGEAELGRPGRVGPEAAADLLVVAAGRRERVGVPRLAGVRLQSERQERPVHVLDGEQGSLFPYGVTWKPSTVTAARPEFTTVSRNTRAAGEGVVGRATGQRRDLQAQAGAARAEGQRRHEQRPGGQRQRRVTDPRRSA